MGHSSRLIGDGYIPQFFLIARLFLYQIFRNLFVYEQWVSWRGENILWLPFEHRPRHVAVLGGIVAFGYKSGRVLFMEFDF
jgi:hypothetical protein